MTTLRRIGARAEPGGARCLIARMAIAGVALASLAGCAALGAREAVRLQLPSPPALSLSTPAAPLDGPIDATASTPIAPAAMIARLAEADIVILGEVHDNPDHHAWQAWIVSALHRARRGALSGAPEGVQGIAFEMFPATVETAAAAHLADGGSVETLDQAIGWSEGGWPEWRLYAPIVAAAPGARLTGGAFERGALRALSRDPAAWPEAERFGVLEPLPAEEQAAREREQMAVHCDMLPATIAPMMVTAQRLWDASFADAALRARRGADGAPIDGAQAVLITGSQHARKDRGVPVALARAAPTLTVASVAFVEVSAEAASIDAVSGREAFDYVIATGAPERGDPCDALRAQ